MVLPILSSLSKIDKDIYEVASDLGASSFVQFITLTLSLSLAGIFSGFLLVFIPSFGEFVIPELLGGSNQIMIGKLLWTEFFRSRDWPFASSLAIILLIFLIRKKIKNQTRSLLLRKRQNMIYPKMK